MKISYYIGGIKQSQATGSISLLQFIDSHENTKEDMASLFTKIEMAVEMKNPALKAELKTALPFFTPTANFNGRRKYDNIIEFNPIAQLDFDGLNSDNAIEFKEYLFNHYPQIICSYLSPSRRGVKALIRIPKIEVGADIQSGIKEYKDYYRAIESEFGNYDGFDPAPKNLVLPLYLSHDFFMYSRDFGEAKEWDLKEFESDSLKQEFPLPVKPYKKLKSNDKNELRAYRTIRKAIGNIVDSPGHFQLRSACLIFGTRVGAGYVHYEDAKREVEYLVSCNSYLSKGVKGYITTALWALESGYRTPNYY